MVRNGGGFVLGSVFGLEYWRVNGIGWFCDFLDREGKEVGGNLEIFRFLV